MKDHIFKTLLLAASLLAFGCNGGGGGGESSVDNGYLPDPVPTYSLTLSGLSANQYFGIAAPATQAVTGSCSPDGLVVDIVTNSTLRTSVTCASSSYNFTFQKSWLSEGSNAFQAQINGQNEELNFTLYLDTVAPTVSITSSTVINTTNETSYTVSGTCSEDGSVNGVIGSTGYSATCSGGSFTSAAANVSGEGDGSVTINATLTDLAGNASTLDTQGVSKDTVAPALAITLANAINNANDTSYTVAGTCDENGQTVSLDIGGLSFTPTCTASAWNVTGVDVSSVGDGTVNITADISDAAGNPATQATTSVNKNTAVASVAITSAANIDQSNVGDYSVSGTCSENGSAVTVVLGGSITKTPNCSSGTWNTGTFSVSALADGAVGITADHSTATQASTSVTKDLTGDVVTISSAPDITASNETTWSISGTCSSNGNTVTINIDTFTFTPNCSSGTWAVFNQDVSSIADGTNIALTADHMSAPQASTTVNKSTATPTTYNLSVTTTLVTTADLSWDVASTGGFMIDDYHVQYRVKGTSTWLSFSDGVSANQYMTVTGLTESTTYEFQVRVQYDTSNYSGYSNIAEGETKPNSPVFNPYAVMNVGGATASVVVAYQDGTNVTLNGGALVTLNEGDTHAFSSTIFDVVDADKPVFVAGKIGTGTGSNNQGNIVWQPTSWAGKSFSFNATRSNPQELYVYAIENTTVEVYEGTTLLDSATITAGNGTTLSWSNYGSYQVSSTGNILAYHMSRAGGLYYDPKPILPSANEIIGFPSNSMRLTTDSNGTNYSLIHSNSTTATGSLDKDDSPQINPSGGSASLYQGNSLLISADKKISGASFADSNGYCAAPFMPTSFMKTKYIVPVATDYIAFASKTAGTINVYNSAGAYVTTLTLTRTGANANAPYKVRYTGPAAGTRFQATVPVGAWYQPSTSVNAGDDDETIMYGTND